MTDVADLPSSVPFIVSGWPNVEQTAADSEVEFTRAVGGGAADNETRAAQTLGMDGKTAGTGITR
jgi:hypothetical protein